MQSLLAQPEEQWRYTVAWPGETLVMKRDDALAAKSLAAAIDAHVDGENKTANQRRQDDACNAYKRGKCAAA